MSENLRTESSNQPPEAKEKTDQKKRTWSKQKPGSPEHNRTTIAEERKTSVSLEAPRANAIPE